MTVAVADSFDVVIVGAGLSGLRAAADVHAAGLSYVVLEADDRVGGKILSVPASLEGGIVELGAAWINNSSQSEIFALSQEFGFELIEQRATGTNLAQDAQGEVAPFPYGFPGPFTPEELELVQEMLVQVTELVDESNLTHPANGPNAEHLDSMTMLDLTKSMFDTEVARIMVNSLTRGLLGADPEEVSVLFLLNYLKSGTGLANMQSDLEHGGQYLRNRQGNQAFCTKLAAKLKPGSVKLSTAVTGITQSGKTCTVETDRGTKFHCRKVIVSVPTTLYPLIRFQPSLPPAKQLLSKSTALGYYSKTILVFESPWWREADLSGIAFSDQGPISFSRDTCDTASGQYSITCFHIGDAGRHWSKFSAVARRKAVLDQFRAMFGTVVDPVPEPINVLEIEWTKEPWIRGAPSSFMAPTTMTSEEGKAIREPFQNVHFVGTETAHVWKGYLEGAVRSGVRGAKEVIDELKG